MAIKGYNFGPAMFLLELSTQFNIASACAQRLREAAPTWFDDATHEQLERRRAPRDIIADCTAFLSSAGVVSKILFPGRRKSENVISRCARLRELLGLEDEALPLLRDLAVRNSFEHIDERLDKILAGSTNGGLAPLSVSETPPAADATVLRRFDPRHLTISFLKDTVSLLDCMTEMTKVSARLDGAFARLTGPEFKLS